MRWQLPRDTTVYGSKLQPRQTAGFNVRAPTVAVGVGLALTIIGSHFAVQSLASGEASSLAFARAILAAGLLVALAWLGAAVGLRILSMTGVQAAEPSGMLAALGMGVGVIALVVFGVGLMGFYQPPALASMVGVAGVLLRRELAVAARKIPNLARQYLRSRGRFGKSLPRRVAIQLSEVSLLVVTLRALAPPTGYDGLAYHLTAPRHFLSLGRFDLLPELPHANMPFLPQMLNLLGLAFSSVEFAAVLHVFFALLATLVVGRIGFRILDEEAGWAAALIFASSTLLATYGAQPNVDYAVAFFDLLAVLGVLSWMQTRQLPWLIMGGMFMGLSLGSKYLALITAGVLVAGIAVRELRTRRSNWRAVSICAAFMIPAALVASPWYIKNWLWLGHPFWTGFVAGADMESSRYFATQMIESRGLWGVLDLPVRLFQGDIENRLAQPPLLLLALPVYALVSKREPVTLMLTLGLAHLLVWSQGIQAVRYLLPAFGALSVVVAYSLRQCGTGARHRAVRDGVGSWLVAGSAAWGAIAALVLVYAERPWQPILGLTSRDQFVERLTPEFAGIRYLNDHRDRVGKVLVAGDSRLFYLEVPARALHNLDSADVFTGEPEQDLERLQAAGYTHVFLSANQFTWLRRFDPEQRVDRWLNEFNAVRDLGMTLELDTGWARVYRLPAQPTINVRTSP